MKEIKIITSKLEVLGYGDSKLKDDAENFCWCCGKVDCDCDEQFETYQANKE